MWLREIGNKFHRYKLEYLDYPHMTMDADGKEIASVVLSKWWEDGTGEWRRFASGVYDYVVPITVLLQRFIAEDSPNSKYVDSLEQFKKDAFERAEKEQIGGFSSIFDLFAKDPALVKVTTKEECCEEADLTKTKENEGHTEDIHTLHSGESETDTEGPSAGVQE